MSLKNFHILFITTSIILLALTCLWTWQQYQSMQAAAYLIAMAAMLGLSIFLIIYEINFIKNTHEPH